VTHCDEISQKSVLWYFIVGIGCSALGKMMFARAQVSFGVCSKSDVDRQILETTFLYQHPLQIRQGFASEGSD